MTARRKAAPDSPRAGVKITQDSLLALRIHERRMALASAETQAMDIFKPAQHPPGVAPEKREMAMDDAFGGLGEWAGGSLASVLSEGQGFLGYPYLAELAQRPEYRRAVEIIAWEMTRKWVKFTATGDDDKADKLKDIEAEFDRLKVKREFRRAAEIDGFQGRSHIFMDFGHAEDDLGKPIGDGSARKSGAKIAKGSLETIRVIEAMWAYPMAYNASNPLQGDWYRPQHWGVMGRDVHSSRLLTFVGRPVPDILKPAYSFGGLALTQMMKPYVDIWLRTRQSVADLVNAFSTMVLSTNMGGTTGAVDEDFFTRVEFFNRVRSNNGTFVIDKETEEFANVAAPISGLDAIQEQALEHICSVTGIPLVKYTGITPSGLNACVPGDTLVVTDRGEVEIRDIVLSDKVLTRCGFAPLTFAGITKRASELIEIRTDKATLRCTGNHPIWMASTNEFVAAENVQVGDSLLLIGENLATRNTPRQSHGEDNGGGEILSANTRRSTGNPKNLFSFIEGCGKSIVGLYRMGSISIIGTTTRKTINSTTLKRCTASTTPPSIPSTSKTAHAPMGRRLLSARIAGMISSWIGSQAGKSFAAMLAFLPTGARTAPLWLGKSEYAFARCAGNPSQPPGAMRNSVRENAQQQAKIEQGICARIISRILKNLSARAATSDEQKREAHIKSALGAGLNLSQLDASTNYIAPKGAKTEHVLGDIESVVSVKRLKADELVYDLTVGDGYPPEFFANGILVHNSSEGELRVFYDAIAAAQVNLFEEPLERLLRFVQLSLFGEVDPEIGFEFIPLWEMSEKEEAEIRKTDAETGQILIDGGVISPEEERIRIVNAESSPYSGLDPEEAPTPEEQEGVLSVKGHPTGEADEDGADDLDHLDWTEGGKRGEIQSGGPSRLFPGSGDRRAEPAGA